MYKSADYNYEQLSFVDLNESCGMQLDRDNEWIMHDSRLPWKDWEALYAALFPARIGNVAKPCRMVLGSLILYGIDHEEERRYTLSTIALSVLATNIFGLFQEAVQDCHGSKAGAIRGGIR